MAVSVVSSDSRSAGLLTSKFVRREMHFESGIRSTGHLIRTACACVSRPQPALESPDPPSSTLRSLHRHAQSASCRCADSLRCLIVAGAGIKGIRIEIGAAAGGEARGGAQVDACGSPASRPVYSLQTGVASFDAPRSLRDLSRGLRGAFFAYPSGLSHVQVFAGLSSSARCARPSLEPRPLAHTD